MSSRELAPRTFEDIGERPHQAAPPQLGDPGPHDVTEQRMRRAGHRIRSGAANDDQIGRFELFQDLPIDQLLSTSRASGSPMAINPSAVASGIVQGTQAFTDELNSRGEPAGSESTHHKSWRRTKSPRRCASPTSSRRYSTLPPHRCHSLEAVAVSTARPAPP